MTAGAGGCIFAVIIGTSALMKKYIQTEYLKISNFTEREWQHQVHNHNHYEVIFIKKGCGTHHLSGNRHPYQARSLFLLAPCDYHHFCIKEQTEFVFIKFTNVYFKEVENLHLPNRFFRDVETLFIQAGREQWPFIKDRNEEEALTDIIDLVVKEWNKTRSSANETIYFMLQAMISIIRRNLQHYPVSAGQSNQKITAILHYIHRHIAEIGLLQVANLSKVFGYSANYLGIFFKSNVGLSLRDYINRYRIQVIKNRLTSGSMSLKEISFEMGFTDLSHFNKFFREHVNMNPSSFRQQAREPGISINFRKINATQ